MKKIIKFIDYYLEEIPLLNIMIGGLIGMIIGIPVAYLVYLFLIWIGEIFSL